MMEDLILLKSILDLVETTPNDMELGGKIRELVFTVK